MNITIDHIPISKNKTGIKRPGFKMKPTVITIHATGNKTSTAKGERKWLENPSNKRSASWHYVVDEATIIESIPPNEVAYHASTKEGNFTSIGVEMCESGNRELVLKRTLELVRYLMEKHNIRVIKRHYDWNKKNCPRILNNDGKWTGWFQFLSEIFAPVKKEEVKVKILQPSSPTLKKSVELALYRMELNGTLQPKWRQSYLAGQLSIDDAVAILFHAISESFVHNEYSNKK